MGGLFLLSWANLIPSLRWMPIPTFQRSLAFVSVYLCHQSLSFLILLFFYLFNLFLYFNDAKVQNVFELCKLFLLKNVIKGMPSNLVLLSNQSPPHYLWLIRFRQSTHHIRLEMADNSHVCSLIYRHRKVW